jgi:LTXXQ motif family protein
MRKIGACLAIAALTVAICLPSPSEAFGLSVGPFHLGVPLFGLRHHYRHHEVRRIARPHADRLAGLHNEAEIHNVAPQGASSTPLYPVLAAPGIIDDIFWPSSSSAWPFGYDAIFQTAFAKAAADQDLRACQEPQRPNATLDRIRDEVRPSRAQAQALQKLGGALALASTYLAKTCPNDIPAQPVARLQLMEWQIEKLSQALDIIRQPLQDFGATLNDSQRARFAAPQAASGAAAHPDRAANIAPACVAAPSDVDSSVDQISHAVDPNEAQRNAMANMKQSFSNAARELQADCPTALPATPLARLEATEARLDATWRAVVSIQVALAGFEKNLTARQRARFDAADFAAAR